MFDRTARPTTRTAPSRAQPRRQSLGRLGGLRDSRRRHSSAGSITPDSFTRPTTPMVAAVPDRDRPRASAAAMGLDGRAVRIGILFLPELPFLPHMRLSMILGVWPLLISAGGVTLIRQSLGPAAQGARRDNSFHSVAIMGGVGRGVASSDFAGGDAVAVMGGCEINLANAKITSEAVIDVLAFWGGIDIQVPRGWRIENHVLAILGGVVDKTDGNAPAGAPTLIIRGSAIMGGVEIKHTEG